MMGRRVFCIGETVLDIIFQDDRPVAAKPGGSMLNSAVSLGRAGIPVYLISDFATDLVGDLVYRFLLENNVSTKYIDRYSNGKTALALAFLNNQQNAEYDFYKVFPDDFNCSAMPSIQEGDIVLFGSFYALSAIRHNTLIAFIRMAKTNGAFIVYDPNFRKSHLSELASVKPWIIENISLASLVRGSDEDFTHIFGVSDAAEVFKLVQQAGCPMLIYTKNKEGVELLTTGEHLEMLVAHIDPISTIGAGDAFNAGIIYAILNQAIVAAGWNWHTILQHGIRFSENVCLSLDNYISVGFGKALNRNITGRTSF